MKKTINTCLNYKVTEGKKPIGVSQTVPDQTMSLRQILDRYARGLPIEGQKSQIWQGEETNGIDIKSLDLAEIQEMREKHQDNMSVLNKEITDKRILKQKELLKKQVQKEFDDSQIQP